VQSERNFCKPIQTRMCCEEYPSPKVRGLLG
jgi:hypothetical protein